MTTLQVLLEKHRVPIYVGDRQKLYYAESGAELAPYKDELLPLLRPMWASALSRPLEDELVVKDSDQYTFSEKNRVYLVLSGSDISAIFLHKAKEYRDIPGLGVGICLVHENYQGQGLMSQLIKLAIWDTSAQFLVLNTQNQHMVQTIRQFCPKGYLHPIDSPIPDEIRAMAQSFVHHPDQYDAEHMIERRFYSDGNPLYGDRRNRISTHEDIQRFFEENVHFDQGDSVLVIGIRPE